MNNWRIGLFAVVAGLSMAACKEVGTGGSGSTSNLIADGPGDDANNAPIIIGAPATSVTAGTSYTAQAIASDSDGDPLVYSATGLPTWASINASSGQLHGTPSEMDVGTTASIVIRVSDGRAMAALPAFQITVFSAVTPPGTPAPPPVTPPAPPAPPVPGNNAPTISGTPLVNAVSGGNYSFAPTVSNPDGNILGFSISGRPAWATFNVATGALTGTAEPGTYANIVISVSDGSTTSALPAFTLIVSAANIGTANLTWTVPAQNTDGSALVDLSGYRIYHGTSASSLNEIIQVSGANNTSYAFNQLASGTHYFAVAAFTSTGVESAPSAVGSKTIL